MYNSKKYAFNRGTHRALFLAHTKSYVPFILQYQEGVVKYSVELDKNFDEKKVIMEVNLEEKSLKFYRDEKILQ